MRTRPWSDIVRVVVPYALFSGLWLLVSDEVAGALVNGHAALTHVQTAKGVAYVLASSPVLGVLLRPPRRRACSSPSSRPRSAAVAPGWASPWSTAS